MIRFLGDWIRNIALFIIFAVFLEMLMPDNSFKKYIHILLGLVLMLILTKPITSFLLKDFSLEDMIEINELEVERQTILKEKNIIQSNQNHLIIDTYKDKLSMQIKKLIESNTDYTSNVIHIMINEDTNSEDYGTIEELKIQVTDKQSGSPEMSTIEPIKPITIHTKTKKDNRINDSYRDIETEKNIKNLLINFYNLSGDNIHIIVQKK